MGGPITVISLARTFDPDLVRRIVTDARIYRKCGDDYAPHPEVYRPLDDPAMIYLAVSQDDTVRGIFALIPHSRIMFEVHTCLLPEILGDQAAEAAQKLLGWIWEHTPCMRLITAVPAYNRLAFKFAKAAGMTEWGCNPRAYMKGGGLHDIIMLGLSRPEGLRHS